MLLLFKCCYRGCFAVWNPLFWELFTSGNPYCGNPLLWENLAWGYFVSEYFVFFAHLRGSITKSENPEFFKIFNLEYPYELVENQNLLTTVSFNGSKETYL